MGRTVTVLIEVGGTSVTSILEVGQEVLVDVGTQTFWACAKSRQKVVLAWDKVGLRSPHAAKVRRRSEPKPVKLGGTRILATIC